MRRISLLNWRRELQMCNFRDWLADWRQAREINATS